MNVTLMVVPGKIITISVSEGITVMSLARKASEVSPGVDWPGLVRDREVRVNKKKFSNVETVDAAAGYAGSIVTTPLENGDVVLVITSIAGNDGTTGVLTCTINDEDYALKTPDTIANVLRDLTDINPDDVVSITVNGDEAHLEDLIGDGDYIEVELNDDDDEDDEDDDDSPVIVVDGESFEADQDGKLAAIGAILRL